MQQLEALCTCAWFCNHQLCNGVAESLLCVQKNAVGRWWKRKQFVVFWASHQTMAVSVVILLIFHPIPGPVVNPIPHHSTTWVRTSLLSPGWDYKLCMPDSLLRPFPSFGVICAAAESFLSLIHCACLRFRCTCLWALQFY